MSTKGNTHGVVQGAKSLVTMCVPRLQGMGQLPYLEQDVYVVNGFDHCFPTKNQEWLLFLFPNKYNFLLEIIDFSMSLSINDCIVTLPNYCLKETHKKHIDCFCYLKFA